MRGVCALNLEAMKVLSPSSSKTNSQTELSVHPSGNTGNESVNRAGMIARRKLTADLESATDLEYRVVLQKCHGNGRKWLKMTKKVKI